VQQKEITIKRFSRQSSPWSKSTSNRSCQLHHNTNDSDVYLLHEVISATQTNQKLHLL